MLFQIVRLVAFLVPITIIFIGIDSMKFGKRIHKMYFVGDFSSREIAISTFFGESWNKKLAVLTIFRMKILRILQIILILMLAFYVISSVSAAIYASSTSRAVEELLVDTENVVESTELVMVSSAAAALIVFGCFTYFTKVTIQSDIEEIEKEIAERKGEKPELNCVNDGPSAEKEGAATTKGLPSEKPHYTDISRRMFHWLIGD